MTLLTLVAWLLSRFTCTLGNISNWNCGDSSTLASLNFSTEETIQINGTDCASENSPIVFSTSSTTLQSVFAVSSYQFNNCQDDDDKGCGDITITFSNTTEIANDICSGENATTVDVFGLSRQLTDAEAFSYTQDNFTRVCQNNAESNPRLLTEITVGYDSIVILLKSGTDIANCFADGSNGLSLDDLRRIFSSASDSITRWDGLTLPGCTADLDNDISLYGLSAERDEYDVFMEQILNGDTFDNNLMTSPDGDSVVEDLITINNFGIGFVDFGFYYENYFGSGDVVAVHLSSNGDASNFIEPTKTNIQAENYPLRFDLSVFVEDTSFADNDNLYDYLSFLFEESTQALLSNVTGLVALTSDDLSEALTRVSYRGALSTSYTPFYGDLGGDIPQVFSTNCARTQTTFLRFSGSTTVYPLAKVWAYHYIEFVAQEYFVNEDVGGCVEITVAGGGSSDGADDVCDGSSDIGDMSRGWKVGSEADLIDAENDIYLCKDVVFDAVENTCLYILQIELAIDGLTVFMKNDSSEGQNSVVECIEQIGGLSRSQIADIFFRKEAFYKDLDFMAECNIGGYTSIDVYTPDQSSGTLDLFCEEVFGDSCLSQNDTCVTYETGDDNELIRIITDGKGRIGFGAYELFAQNSDNLYAIPIKINEGTNGTNSTGIAPSHETIADGTYPLTRPLYMNAAAPEDSNKNSVFSGYLTFGFETDMGQTLVHSVLGYSELSDEAWAESVSKKNVNDFMKTVSDIQSEYTQCLNTTNAPIFDWNCSAIDDNARYGYLGGDRTAIVSPSREECSGSVNDSFILSGSSTVYPLAKIWAVEFAECQALGCSTITVRGGGTDIGAEDVCDGLAEIADMSRSFEDPQEAFVYTQNSNTFGCNRNYSARAGAYDSTEWTMPSDPLIVTQIPLAYDGVTIIISSNSELLNSAGCLDNGLTYKDLKWIFTDDAEDTRARTWQNLDANCPDAAIEMFGADPNSGTYDFIKEEVLENENFGTNYIGNDDDDEILEAVANASYGIGYVPYGHYFRNRGELEFVAVCADRDNYQTDLSSTTCFIEPNEQTIASKEYPISRTIYMSVNSLELANDNDIFNFFTFGFGDIGQGLLVNKSGYVQLNAEELEDAKFVVESRGILSRNNIVDYYGDLGGGINKEFPSTANCLNYDFDSDEDGRPTVVITGSSTVYPIANVWLYHFIEWMSFLDVCVEFSVDGPGSSTGASEVCASNANIGDMSRQFRSYEANKDDVEREYYVYTCEDSYFKQRCLNVVQIDLATDGLTIFVQNDATASGNATETSIVDCIKANNGLTFDELNAIFSSSNGETYADILGSDCPDIAIARYVPSGGTFDFFCEEVFPDDDDLCSFADDLTAIDDDVELIESIVSNAGGIGFVGYAHFSEYLDLHADSLWGVPVKLDAAESDDGQEITGVPPTRNTIDNGTYPLTRPLYMNVRHAGDKLDKVISDLIVFGMNSSLGVQIIESLVGYVALTDETLNEFVTHADHLRTLWSNIVDPNVECGIADTSKEDEGIDEVMIWGGVVAFISLMMCIFLIYVVRSGVYAQLFLKKVKSSMNLLANNMAGLTLSGGAAELTAQNSAGPDSAKSNTIDMSGKGRASNAKFQM